MDEPRARCLADLQRAPEAPRYTAAMITTTLYSRVYHGAPDQLGRVRREVRDYLEGCLLPDDTADEAVLIISEFAANAVKYSRSRGAFFIVRCETFPAYTWCEVEDLGGQWHCRLPDATYPHGLSIVEALAGPDNWGVEELSDGRIVWCRLALEGQGHA